MKKLLILAAFLGLGLLTACGEKPQSAGGIKQDAPPHTGTGKAFAEKNWKQGDKASWEAQLKSRGMNGQNEYSRTN